MLKTPSNDFKVSYRRMKIGLDHLEWRALFMPVKIRSHAVQQWMLTYSAWHTCYLIMLYSRVSGPCRHHKDLECCVQSSFSQIFKHPFLDILSNWQLTSFYFPFYESGLTLKQNRLWCSISSQHWKGYLLSGISGTVLQWINNIVNVNKWWSGKSTIHKQKVLIDNGVFCRSNKILDNDGCSKSLDARHLLQEREGGALPQHPGA